MILFICAAMYYVTKSALKNTGKEIKPEEIEIISQKYIVDSLLVVVDSLTVQVDSLSRLENYITYVDKEVDTAFIIRKYYSKTKQTIQHKDSAIHIKFNFNLHKNKVELPKLEYKILRPIKIVNYIKPVKKHKNRYFVGVTIGGSFLDASVLELRQIAPEILLIKSNHGLKLGYNLLEKTRNIYVGYYFKIR